MTIQNVQNSMLTRNWIQWYNNFFKSHGYYGAMQATIEDSKFHRENSVAAHTDMVVMNMLQLNLADGTMSAELPALAGLFAAAFHDVGKPQKREAKHSKERGDYFAYHGHELQSARMWEDFFMAGPEKNGITEELFGPDIPTSLNFMFMVGYMIEHHLPWGMKDDRKIDGLSLTLHSLGVRDEFYRLLLADNMGRITDDPENLTKSMTQIERLKSSYNEFLEINQPVKNHFSVLGMFTSSFATALGVNPPELKPMDVPMVIIPIGPSGSGKSALYKEIDTVLDVEMEEVLHHSMDDIRAENYGNDPHIAFKMSQDDPNFQNMVQQDFIEKIKTGQSVFVDNTNISRKRRRFYIDQAQRRGYQTVGILMPATLSDLISRQKTRPDGKVPAGAIAQQYFNMSYPTLGLEFDAIHMLNRKSDTL